MEEIKNKSILTKIKRLRIYMFNNEKYIKFIDLYRDSYCQEYRILLSRYQHRKKRFEKYGYEFGMIKDNRLFLKEKELEFLFLTTARKKEVEEYISNANKDYENTKQYKKNSDRY